MKKRLELILFLFQILRLSSVTAQYSEADSIISILESTSSIERKIEEYVALGDLFKGNNPDTAMFFYKKVLEINNNISTNNKTKKNQANSFLSIAEIFLYKGQYDSTLRYISGAEEICSKNNLPHEAAIVENQKGLVCFYKSQYEEALNYYEHASQIAKKNKDTGIMARVFSNMAIVNYYQGNYDNAITLFKKPVEIGKESNDKDLFAGSLINLGIIYSNIGELDSATNCFLKSKKIYKSLNDIGSILLCNENIAMIYYTKSQYDKALSTYFEILDIHAERQNKQSIATVKHNIADIYMRLGDFENSLKYYLQSMEIKKELADKKGMAQTLKGLGQLHVNQKNYTEAEEYFRQSRSIYNEINYPGGIANANSSLADIYFEQEEFEKAESLYDSAQLIYKNTNNKMAISDLLLHKASLFIKQKKYELATEVANEAQILKKELEDKSGMSLSYYYLSVVNLETHNLKDALKNAQKAWDLAEGINILPTLIDISEVLSTTYEKLGNKTDALNYAKRQIQLKDSLYNKEKTEAMLMAEMRWQTKNKQEQIEKLEQEQQINQLQLEKSALISKRQKLFIILLIGGLLLSGFAIFLLVQIYKRRRELMFEKHLSNITKLRMQNIQNRISPHFFFNALSSTAIPLSNFPEQKQLFDKLVLLLRHSLLNIEKIAVPLSAEMQIVDSYIGIHQINRKGDFEYHRNINIEDIDEYQIPAMILQVPVENAIKHGLNPLEGKKDLSVMCNQNHTSLNLIVKDNGVGRKNTTTVTKGTGSGLKLLMQTIHLLNQQNSEKIEFNIDDADKDNQTGTVVKITIPKNFKYHLLN